MAQLIAQTLWKPDLNESPATPATISNNVDLPICELDGAEWGTLRGEKIYRLCAQE